MLDKTGGNSTIRNYLLGDLPESELERIEKWYFADAQAVDELWAVFGEMAEERLSGALSESEALRFEQRLRSSPALRKMFENEEALHDHAARIAASASRQAKSDDAVSGGWRHWRLPAAFFKPPRLVVTSFTAIIALGALITWLALRGPESPNPEATQQAGALDQRAPDNIARPSVVPPLTPQPGRGANDSLVEEEKLRPARRKSAPGTGREIMATFLLLPAGTRGEKSDPILKIPARTETVQLEIEPPTDDCAVYSAVLQTESGEELQRWDSLRAEGARYALRVARLRVPAGSLKNADYAIRLECVARFKDPVPATQYRFKVERK
jgi:hypothetical protein